MSIILKFNDGQSKDFAKGVKAEDVVKEHFSKEMQKVLAVKLDDKQLDLSSTLDKGGDFDIITSDTPEGLAILRHSSSHIMALAVKRLYPGVKVTIGPSVEDGFYYDFDNLKVNEEDFKKIEDEMDKIIHEKLSFNRKEVSKQEALKIFMAEPYKIELINELPVDETISTYSLGEFEDFCRGPHVPNSKAVGAIKLMKLAGAYWKGDSKNKMLTRIYGISFPEKKQLVEYLARLEEAKKRDHKKLGPELEWFFFHDYSPGSPFFQYKGAIIYNELLVFLRAEYVKRGYQEVITPLLYDKALWETSGHWDHFKDDMFVVNIDNREFALKPMNCPSHCLIYKTRMRSYRELPIRIADFAALHRNELKGVLGGLTRVRKFSQDDAHIFCTLEQVEDEINRLIDFTSYIYRDVFKMDFSLAISTKPAKCMGGDDVWCKAEAALEEALNKNKLPFKINPGGGAFYGPKIDLSIKDSLGREWQCATIQLDFNLPERFDLEFEGGDGLRHRPVMIHRALLGSLERFIGVIIEHFAGKLPLWLNPVQVKILPIADRHVSYAQKIADEMKHAGLRVELDLRSESTSKKVRDAQVEKVNYIVVVGDKEEADSSINVRTRDGQIKGTLLPADFIKELLVEISEKRI